MSAGILKSVRSVEIVPSRRLPAVERTADQLLAEARARLPERVDADELADVMAAGALVVDTRSEAQRRRDGELPGAVVIERNVLEWRLDPASAYRLPEAGDRDRRIVVVCDEGYASSLAAATLQDLGLKNATDLDGGYQAWVSLRRDRGG
jgi:rhodanese-related sulfurtransferase